MSLEAPKILIVKLSAIGDVVHTLPALNALRQNYPRAHITWLVEEAAADLIIGHSALDRVLVSRRKTWIDGLRGPQWRNHLRQIVAFVRGLRETRYDMIFDFQASLKGAALIALARGKRKIGFDRGLEHQELSYLALNERIAAISMEVHALTRGLKLLSAMGIEYHAIDYKLPISAHHAQQAEQLLVDHGLPNKKPFVVVNPMAKWETKLWNQDRLAQLADAIVDRFSLPVVMTGGKGDQGAIKNITMRMKRPAVDLSGHTDLVTLAAVLRNAVAMVTTDTGPMHMAAAVKTPTVALFGPTAPWRTGPFGPEHRIVRVDMDCSPCFKRQCTDSAACMQAISVNEVLSAIAELLDKH